MADHYILDGGTGDGSAWNNALDALPATLTRGDTYYIGDGAYAAYAFDDAASGATYIYIKKATVAAHGTSTGWQDSYGDGVAVFTGSIDLTATNYLDVDGVVGSGTSGHGFKFQVTGTEASVLNMWDTDARSHIRFAHCEIAPNGEDLLAPGAGTGEQHSVRIYNTTHVTFSYCYFHDVETTHFQCYAGWTDLTIEYSVLARRHTVSTVHGEIMMLASAGNPSNFIFRYNRVEDSNGSGMVYFDNGDFPGPAYIYGNVFVQTSARYGTSNGQLGGGGNHAYSNITVYNNTFLNGYAYGGGGEITQPAVGLTGNGGGSSKVAQNNVAYNTTGIAGTTTKSYNTYDDATQAAADASNGEYWSGGDSLFDNLATFDLHLAADTDAWTSLDSPYNTDMDGETRTSSRGAYQYVTGGATLYGYCEA